MNRGETDGLRLPAAGPLHLEATVRLLQRRPANRVDRFEDDAHHRVFETRDGLLLVSTRNRGSLEEPDLRMRITGGRASSSVQQELGASVRRMLGLDHDPGLLQRIGRAEPRLRPIAAALRGMRAPRYPELFESLANTIPFQQVSLDAGIAIVTRFVERYGRRLERRGGPWYAFPSAEAVAVGTVAELRALGLSRTKAESLHHLAGLVASGELTLAGLEALPTPEAEARLRELPGIGPWSAGLVLLRGLGRLDAFPRGDVGAARGLMTLLGERAGFDHEGFAAGFGEARGYLYFFSLGASLLARGLIHPASPPP